MESASGFGGTLRRNSINSSRRPIRGGSPVRELNVGVQTLHLEDLADCGAIRHILN